MNTITHLVALVAGLALTLMLHITPSWGAGTTNSTDNAPQVSTPGGSGGPSKEYTERWAVWEAEWKRAMTAADGDALLCSAEEYLNLTRELTQYITTESNTEDILRMAAAMEESARRAIAEFDLARKGEVVAASEFDPGIAPFTVEVRKVPVPVTNSHHFIVSLYRGEYVVTSFRYFWPGYTPERVHISWPCINQFTVTFDDKYEAKCDWKWGAGATWSMTVPEGSRKPGLSAYFFTPRNSPPPGCQDIPPE